MCDLLIISRGSRWVLLDEDAQELAQFRSEADALTAASSHLRTRGEPAHILIGDDGDWREEVVGDGYPHH